MPVPAGSDSGCTEDARANVCGGNAEVQIVFLKPQPISAQPILTRLSTLSSVPQRNLSAMATSEVYVRHGVGQEPPPYNQPPQKTRSHRKPVSTTARLRCPLNLERSRPNLSGVLSVVIILIRVIEIEQVQQVSIQQLTEAVLPRLDVPKTEKHFKRRNETALPKDVKIEKKKRKIGNS